MTQREIIRGIYGPVQDKGCLHLRWNSETYNMYKYLSITNGKIRRKEWAGHVIRIRKYPKKVLNGKFCITRPAGKPTKRWEDVIQRETSRILRIQGWRKQQEPRVE